MESDALESVCVFVFDLDTALEARHVDDVNVDVVETRRGTAGGDVSSTKKAH